MKRKLLRCMTVLATMFVASCSSELALEGAPNNGVDGEEVEVTFSISPESAHAVMRDAEASGPGKHQTVGRGQKIDMLIYAVYEKENGYTLLTQYGLGPVDKDLNSLPNGNKFEISEAFKTSSTHTGQTIIDVSETIQQGKSQTISLRLMRNKEYYIAFWAQSSETGAFNTDDLENVQVIYENAMNNDELRDAFCKVESFSVSPSQTSRTVILTRPMAQINVGTTGADYKTVIEDKKRVFIESKISFTGAAQFLNVVTNEVLTKDKEGKSTLTDKVEFSFNTIPAYINMESLPTGDTRFDGSNANEELLWVDLNNDGSFKDYRTEYPTLGTDSKDKDNYFLTEKFKYLSMCYVLVPATETKIPNYDSESDQTTSSQESYNSSVLENISVSFMGVSPDNDDIKQEVESVKLEYVPVHRNWRTNILCGLYDHNIPNTDNPNDPDDPTSIYKTPYVLLNLNPNFEDEYNGTDSGDADNSWQFIGTSGN